MRGWLGVVAALVLSGCGSAGAGDILLVTVDTLRADHLGLYGYPRATSPQLDAFFAEGAIYERAWSTEANTPPATLSLLSGLQPQQHGVRIFYQLLRDDIPLLTDLLPPEYQTAAVVSNMVLTDEAVGLASRFDHFDDFVDERENSTRVVYERNAKNTTDAAVRWLLEERDPERPAFLWVHYIDPHGPYRPPADLPRRFTHEGRIPLQRDRLTAYLVEPGVDDALDYVDRYDEEIAYTDHHIGRLLDTYAEHHPVDRALVALSADHGETMIEHEAWFNHGYQVYEGIARIPFLLRGPGVARGRSRAPVSGIDLAPTLLGFAGVAPPERWDGYDLRREPPPADRIVFTEALWHAVDWRAAIRGEEKWVVGVKPETRAREAHGHFDLSRDPSETRRGPWVEDGEVPAALEAWIAADPDAGGLAKSRRDGKQRTTPKVSPRADDAARERLRALGYVE